MTVLALDVTIAPPSLDRHRDMSRHMQARQCEAWRFLARQTATDLGWPTGLRLARVEFQATSPDAAGDVAVYPCAVSMLAGLRDAGVVVAAPAVSWLPDVEGLPGGRLTLWPVPA